MGKDFSIYKMFELLAEPPGKENFQNIRQKVGQDTFYKNKTQGGNATFGNIDPGIPKTAECVAQKEAAEHGDQLQDGAGAGQSGK